MSGRDIQGVGARSGAIDALRVVGVVAVVVGHVWDNQGIQALLYTWHVPLFFFLTGYLWRPGRRVGAELRNRWLTLGRPYLTWLILGLGLVVVHAIVVLKHLEFSTVGWPLYGGAFARRPFSTFWFVSVLLFVALLYRIVERLPVWAQALLAVGGVAAGYLFGQELAMTPLSVASAWPCLAFVLAGRLFAHLEPRIPGRPALAGVAMIAGGAALITIGLSGPMDIKQGDYGTSVVAMLVAVTLSAGGVLVAKAAFARLPQSASRMAVTLAAPALLVVLAHPIVLGVLGTTDDGGVLDLALALAGPWVLGLVAMRTKARGWLVGAKSAAPARMPAAERALAGSRSQS